MSEFLELPLASIEVGTDRARPLDPNTVVGLAAIIEKQGLLQPVVVRKAGDNYQLVAGNHRLEAVRKLGWPKIPARLLQTANDDEAKLAEVMENLGRNELIALDRCHHLYELKQVWERLYPETAGRTAGATAMHKKRATANFADADITEVFGFSEANADKIGLSARTIRLAVKIYTGLVPTVRKRLVGTDTATKQTELKALSELSAQKQIKVLDAIQNDDLPEIGNVAQALAYLGENVVCDPLEKRFAAVSKSIADLDDDTFDSVIAAHEDRVIKSLHRRGRI